jgi:hypothetical protein
MKLDSCHPPSAYNFEIAARFLENLLILGLRRLYREVPWHSEKLRWHRGCKKQWWDTAHGIVHSQAIYYVRYLSEWERLIQKGVPELQMIALYISAALKNWRTSWAEAYLNTASRYGSLRWSGTLVGSGSRKWCKEREYWASLPPGPSPQHIPSQHCPGRATHTCVDPLDHCPGTTHGDC